MTNPLVIPVYVPTRISPPETQRISVVNYLTQGYELLLETLDSLCDSIKNHSEERRMKGSFVSNYVFLILAKKFSHKQSLTS